MKKLLFLFSALLMAGSAMADRVVTFNATTDHLVFQESVPYDIDGDGGYDIYTLSKDGVTITFKQIGDDGINDNWYYIASGMGLLIKSELYSVDEEAPSYERYYGGIKRIEFDCMAGSMTNPGNFYIELPHAFDDEYYTQDNLGIYVCYSEEGHCPQFVQFGNYGHVICYSITVTLYGVEDPVTPPVEPSGKTDAPSSQKENYVFNDGNIYYNAYHVTLIPTEESEIWYRVGILSEDGDYVYGDWMLYTDVLTFDDEGTYMIEAYAIANGKTESDHIWDGFTVSKLVDVEEIMAGKTVANVRYFNVAGQEMAQPNGLTIQVTTYTDGTTSAVKVVK